jgi:alpha-beta hydrolase superfamily lysophospholipase
VAVATYVLIHGASSDSWYWHRVLPLLTACGHEVVAPDLPATDDAAGFEEYADTVVQAIGERRGLIVVAQSMGGFTAPVVRERLGFAPDEMNSGHLPALAHPVELVERLETYRRELALN